MPKLLVTGSSGVIGSEVVGYFYQHDWDVHGADNNMRADFFGPAGDIHSLDVARFIHAFSEAPRCGEVYNIGGGRANSCSISEAFERIAALSGKKMDFEYFDKNREGDHICYISDLTKMKRHFPGWDIIQSLDDIFAQVHQSALSRTA